MQRFSLMLAAGLLATQAAPVAAQDVTGDDLIITGEITQGGSGSNYFSALNNTFDGRACIGPTCDGTEPFEQGPLRLKWSEPDILFEDSSTAGGISSNDWRLVVNDTTTTKFAVQDIDGGTIPFTIAGGVRDNALYLDGDLIGLGTSVPTANLHIEDPSIATLRMHRNTSSGFADADWLIDVTSTGMSFNDEVSGRVPLVLENGAPNNTMRVKSTGRIGIGTNSPDGALHVSRPNGTATVLVENTAASPSAVREMFAMRNNGGSYFTLDNTSSGTTWFFTHEDAAPNRFIITDGVADGPEMTVTADGDLTIQGNFFASSGTELNVPDYVFAEDYALRPLAEVASFIKENSHLPDVPSADEIAQDGLNMTEMQMALLKKVEELTLYTLAQEAENAALRDQFARMEAQLAALTKAD